MNDVCSSGKIHPKIIRENYPTHPVASVTKCPCETSASRGSYSCKQTPFTQEESILHDDIIRSQFKKRKIPNQRKNQSKRKEEGWSL